METNDIVEFTKLARRIDKEVKILEGEPSQEMLVALGKAYEVLDRLVEHIWDKIAV